MIKILVFLSIFLSASQSEAAKLENQNYFASLRSTKTNVRAGPGTNYPVKYSFHLRGIPVKVISKYDNWNEIKDSEGDTGWINKNLLTKKRTAIVKTAKSYVNLHSAATTKSKILLRLENNVVGSLIGCSEFWCKMKIDGKKGWIIREEIWGEEKFIKKAEK